jgi:hypothetical protein
MEETTTTSWPRLVRPHDLIVWAGRLIEKLQKVETATKNALYLQSPNGTKWAVTVSDTGVLTVTAV